MSLLLYNHINDNDIIPKSHLRLCLFFFIISDLPQVSLVLLLFSALQVASSGPIHQSTTATLLFHLLSPLAQIHPPSPLVLSYIYHSRQYTYYILLRTYIIYQHIFFRIIALHTSIYLILSLFHYNYIS